MKALQHFYENEWFFAGPMTVMTLVAFLLVAWRMLLNQSAKTRMDRFLPELQSVLKRKGTKGAVALCRNEKGLIPNVLFVAGLEASEQGVAAMRRSMANAVELEIHPRLNFLLAPILAIAKISTMVGLLGTVISMIGTFSKIGEATAKGPGGGNVGAQAESIGLALFATALGLLTAIPLVFTHVLFKDSIARFETKMKGAAQKLIVLVQNAKSGKLEDPLEAAAEPTPARSRRPADEDDEEDDDRRPSRRERAKR
ncbi:MotA/TolQ/ExbB proton channel family protein [Limnoglobus roseus]|uniref:MotA/TolQ/ExbB proton channel family protein n=1 Tax=Limnoglobus roseus TaxID=2598579 RepID=A0A5C1AJW0_9BACT|nr:MotA/TolQ/ExbB proton channel family protein [Limnoglobus roseus]QEL17198.1 MotA/TolQ/ExbB proton channel family protein [Limnoglobus roseus]